MKNMKNWMMLMVVGAMVSGSIQTASAVQPQEQNEIQVVTNKEGMFDGSRLKNFQKKIVQKSDELKKTIAEKLSTIDGRRMKAMKEKLENFKNKLPGIFDNAMKKVKNGKAIEAIKDMKSKMETLLEKARKSEFITDDQAQNIRTKFNDMKEKLKEKLNAFKSSGGKGISEDVINFINQNSENLKNNIKNYLNKAESQINQMIQG